jgi:hypothetical protein
MQAVNACPDLNHKASPSYLSRSLRIDRLRQGTQLALTPLASGLHARLGIRQSALFSENFFDLR